jgi:hypothetical protein
MTLAFVKETEKDGEGSEFFLLLMNYISLVVEVVGAVDMWTGRESYDGERE